MNAVTYRFEVFEGEDLFASGESPDLLSAKREADHYASQCEHFEVVIYEIKEIERRAT